MRSEKKPEAFLGIAVTSGRIEAVLLRAGKEQKETYEVVHRFKRQHAGVREQVAASSLSTALPGMRGTDEADFTIQVGGGDGGGGLFLPGEFAGLEAKKIARSKAKGDAATQPTPETFALQLKDLLADCAKAGYANPKVGFVLGSPYVSYVELDVPRDQPVGKPAFGKSTGEAFTGHRLSKQERRHLLQLLKEKHEAKFDEEVVAFLPMATFKGQRRFLAVVPEPQEPVTTTLDALAKQENAVYPPVQFMDAEVALYADLVRHTVKPAEHENVAVVRVGAQDTLVLFMNGTLLRHQGRLRSLTSYDAPDTIGSRVMLQQDEQKIGELHHVLLLTEGRPDLLFTTFSRLFGSAAVTTLHQSLAMLGLTLNEKEEDAIKPAAVQAAGAALRLAGAARGREAADAIDLLTKRLHRRPRRRLMVAWHTMAMLVVLFGVTFFYVQRYLAQEAQIVEGRQELYALNASETAASVEALRARVDSLQQVYTQYTRALHVLDSLLVGSDRWSRTLEKTSRMTNELPGVWFESWVPQGGGIVLTGNTTARPRVAQLAERLNATINLTEFAEVNDVRIHPFQMAVPIESKVPMAAQYLQDRAVQEVTGISTARLASDTTTPAAGSDPAQQ